MEMISPDFFKESNKEKSVEELSILKCELENELLTLEKICRHPEDSLLPFYDNNTRLKCSKLYLTKIVELINEKSDANEH